MYYDNEKLFMGVVNGRRGNGITGMNLLSESLESLQKLPNEGGDEKEDEANLLETLQEQGDRGNAIAKFSLAKMCLKEGDNSRAMSYLQSAVQQGDTQAMYQLAVMKYEGICTEQSYGEGFELMLKISNSDNKSLASTAQFNIGRAYFQGYGIKQSTDEAIKWWEKCSKSNTPASMRAMNTLALLYSTPDLVNEEKAFHWHVLAAERGHMDSMGTLGLLYMKGHGCAVNKELALKWFKKSAENGSIYGSGLLSNYYYSNKMYSKAVEMARSVCDCNQEDIDKLTVLCQSIPSLIIEGLATANYIYGQCLYHGQGTVKDTLLSHSYFIKARDYNPAITARLHSRMTYGKL